MSRRFALLAVLAVAPLGLAASPARAQAPAPVVIYQGGPYVYQYQAAPSACPECGRVHAPGAVRGERSRFRGPNAGGTNANPYLGPNRLPRGQVYYNGRYFGSFNNRFYGPQYGYF